MRRSDPFQSPLHLLVSTRKMATVSRVWLGRCRGYLLPVFVSDPVEVTGTSSGFGRALVEAVLAKGERVVAATRSSASLDTLAHQHPADRLLIIQLDITDPVAIASAFDTIEGHFGRLDVVVNNAGYGLKGEMEAIPDDVARALFETLFWGPVHITKHVRPYHAWRRV